MAGVTNLFLNGRTAVSDLSLDKAIDGLEGIRILKVSGISPTRMLLQNFLKSIVCWTEMKEESEQLTKTSFAGVVFSTYAARSGDNKMTKL